MAYAPFDLNGKTAVVIGGTSGIGRALSHGLAEAGANVVATSRTMDQVETVAREIEDRGSRTLRLVSDVSERSSLERVLHKCIDAFEKVDILINSAGRTKRTPTVDLSEDDWNQILDTNLTGTLRACQIFGRHMLERRYGRIINIASIASFVALQEVAAYCASKAAVASLINETERGREFIWRTPMKRFGKVEELAGAAVFLASDAASFMTGEILVVDGGLLASGMNQ